MGIELELLKASRENLAKALQQETEMLNQVVFKSNIFLLNNLINEIKTLNNEQTVPHTELKAQYLLDVETCRDIEGLEAWKLWQYCFDGGFKTLKSEISGWCINFEYRRHPHADNIIKYHQGSERDKKRWQFKRVDTSVWLSFDGKSWLDDCEYRIKPETITINGKEYIAPLRARPENRTKYYEISIGSNCTIDEWFWYNTSKDIASLNNGLCFTTEEDAQAVLNALQTILKGENHK